MPTQRSYGEFCGIARALDTVGERWAMLIVRELMLGPRRFSELRIALPTSSNILTDRLNELTERGVVRQARIPGSPTAGQRYELTPAGSELAPILIQLGDWGLKHGTPSDDPRLTRLSSTSVLVYVQEHVANDAQLPNAIVHAHIDGQSWTIRSQPDQLTVRAESPENPTAELETNAFTLDGVLHHTIDLDDAIATGKLTIDGDEHGARALLAAIQP